jgi:hypothetical protein
MTKMPPVPPENQNPHGPDTESKIKKENTKPDDRQRNLAQQGRQGNIKQNTTNQGHQQDR